MTLDEYAGQRIVEEHIGSVEKDTLAFLTSEVGKNVLAHELLVYEGTEPGTNHGHQRELLDARLLLIPTHLWNAQMRREPLYLSEEGHAYRISFEPTRKARNNQDTYHTLRIDRVARFNRHSPAENEPFFLDIRGAWHIRSADATLRMVHYIPGATTPKTEQSYPVNFGGKYSGRFDPEAPEKFYTAVAGPEDAFLERARDYFRSHTPAFK
jgi:hypothetical protein